MKEKYIFKGKEIHFKYNVYVSEDDDFNPFSTSSTMESENFRWRGDVHCTENPYHHSRYVSLKRWYHIKDCDKIIYETDEMPVEYKPPYNCVGQEIILQIGDELKTTKIKEISYIPQENTYLYRVGIVVEEIEDKKETHEKAKKEFDEICKQFEMREKEKKV